MFLATMPAAGTIEITLRGVITAPAWPGSGPKRGGLGVNQRPFREKEPFIPNGRWFHLPALPLPALRAALPELAAAGGARVTGARPREPGKQADRLVPERVEVGAARRPWRVARAQLDEEVG